MWNGMESRWNPGGNRQKFGWAPCQRNSRWNDQESMEECKVLTTTTTTTTNSSSSRLEIRHVLSFRYVFFSSSNSGSTTTTSGSYRSSNNGNSSGGSRLNMSRASQASGMFLFLFCTIQSDFEILWIVYANQWR